MLNIKVVENECSFECKGTADTLFAELAIAVMKGCVHVANADGEISPLYVLEMLNNPIVFMLLNRMCAEKEEK